VEIRFIWIGRTKDPGLLALLDEFTGRIRRFNRLSIVEMDEKKRKGNGESALNREGERLLNVLKGDSFAVVLDKEGRMLDSEKLAVRLDQWMMMPKKTLDFVVGSFAGLSRAVKERADFCWSLSPLTFSHELSRVLLAEQVYRAFTICKGLPYHK
jgi:23S rRNA (pseudouridine1915-N3)-methyltransferase